MEPSTEQVMQALGEEDGFRIAGVLIKEGAQSQSALSESAAVSPQRTSTQLALMRALGLVEREPAARGKWSITDPEAVARIFAAAATLAGDLSAQRTKASAADRRAWEAQAKRHAKSPRQG